MARYGMNREGMTFEEWVCAAGCARFGYLCAEGFLPYSATRTVPVAAYLTLYREKRIVWKTESRTNYPRWVRHAWRNGEDPTEYRERSGRAF